MMLQVVKEKTHLLSSILVPDYPTYQPGSNIWVFKTNIRYKKDVQKIKPILNQHFGRTGWNIAIDDIDKVLRVET